MYHVTFPPRSNRASWLGTGLITDLDNNPIDLTGCSIVFQIQPPCEERSSWDGYGYGYGYPSNNNARGSLTASTDNGKITIVDIGVFQWSFTLDDMRSLCSGTYDTGITVTNDDGTQTEQLSVGPLPIVSGVVP